MIQYYMKGKQITAVGHSLSNLWLMWQKLSHSYCLCDRLIKISIKDLIRSLDIDYVINGKYRSFTVKYNLFIFYWYYFNFNKKNYLILTVKLKITNEIVECAKNSVYVFVNSMKCLNIGWDFFPSHSELYVVRWPFTF